MPPRVRLPGRPAASGINANIRHDHHCHPPVASSSHASRRGTGPAAGGRLRPGHPGPDLRPLAGPCAVLLRGVRARTGAGSHHDRLLRRRAPSARGSDGGRHGRGPGLRPERPSGRRGVRRPARRRSARRPPDVRSARGRLLALAGAGLLDGRGAATHWGAARELAEKNYPDVDGGPGRVVRRHRPGADERRSRGGHRPVHPRGPPGPATPATSPRAGPLGRWWRRTATVDRRSSSPDPCRRPARVSPPRARGWWLTSASR